ncbi:hypothetical protein Tsubulata_028258 [Turnera subulata]|uniref:DUF4283 domain-containing protein n=1 Tax=Turnera subulata TaxID=218843 RepID=A0A9Q0F987_9ROSI|nr:hypothetical protein Tsubulata_028258 [Turnera subulata]
MALITMVFASSEDDSLAAAPAVATDVAGTSLSNPSAPSFMDKVPPDKLEGAESSLTNPITMGLPNTVPAPWVKGRDGAISVSHYKDGLFLFQFPNESAYSRALARGHWHVGGIPLMLWPWCSSTKKMDFC